MALTWVKIGNLKGPKGDVGTWWKRNLTSSDNLDTMTIADAGAYSVLAGSTAEALKLPRHTPSSVEILPVGVALIQIQRSLAPSSEVHQREKYANGEVWGAWRRTDHHTDLSQTLGLMPATEAGFKTAGIAGTVGYGGAQTTGQGFARSLMRMPAAGTRVRARLRNWNPRYNMADSPAVALSNISIGINNSGASQSTAWTVIASSGSTGTDGYVSPWITIPAGMGGRDVLLAFGWQSSGDVQQNIGYGFTGASAANATVGTGTATNTLPLFIALEVEMPSGQPVVAVFGDSLSSGVSASKVVYDSWLDQWARQQGIVPTHWSHSGDQASSWSDPTGKKWTPYGPDVALADAVFWAMGSNTIFRTTTPTLAELQAETIATVAMLKKHVSPNVYATTILPRTGVTGAGETVRQQYNAWLRTSGLFRDVFDVAAAVSNGSNLKPEFDADGIHLTTAGYAAMAAVISRDVVSRPAIVKVSETAGRVFTAWDYLNGREQLISGDTGLRSVSLETGVSGLAFLRREGNRVTFFFREVITPDTSSVIYRLPSGFTPDYSPRYDFQGRTGGRVQAYFTIASGSVTQNGSQTGSLYASMTFTTNDPWPTSLPGVAA